MLYYALLATAAEGRNPREAQDTGKENVMELETLCLYAGYNPKNGEPQSPPIVQSTTFKYESTEQVGNLFDLKEAGFFYTRLGNPTVDVVEKKITALEGGVGALCTASGQAANAFAIMNIASAGDHIISTTMHFGARSIYCCHVKTGHEVTFVAAESTIRH